MITREQVQEQLDAMQQQAAYLSDQLKATRGAVQVLERLLAMADDSQVAARLDDISPAPVRSASEDAHGRN